MALPLAALAASLAVASSAPADVYKPLHLASDGFLVNEGITGENQQALYAHDAAVSGNGVYVAFDGYYAGLSGVWRRNLQSGEVQPVAVGAQTGVDTCAGLSPCDALLPSISESGQYVSFTTRAPLDRAEDPNSAPDVYVRNMDVPESQHCEEEAAVPAQPCAFTLVSSVSAAAQQNAGLGAEALSYEGTSEYGSIAAGRSAISADGKKVAFVTTSISNLAGPGTPALQVAVRNLQTRETELVSAELDPATGLPIPGKPVSGNEGGTLFGAVYSPGGAPGPFFQQFMNRAYGIPPVIGASISADGSTVSWLGQDVFKQARMLPGERVPSYAEPLWRRIEDGPEAPIRRVTGGSEPENPECQKSGENHIASASAATESDPCQGPFAVVEGSGTWSGPAAYPVPQLSADGYTVAFLATATRVALGQNFGSSGESDSDAYIADMHEGVTRRAALRPLTTLASGHESELTATAPIVDIGISPDGKQIAFSTKRTRFPLGSPTYISAPDSEAGMVELFNVDLTNDTLTRVTRGYAGGASEHPHKSATVGTAPYTQDDGALSPSFSQDGNVLTFASTASNLIYGDGNTPPLEGEIRGSIDGSDVFDIERETFVSAPAQTYVTAPPPAPAATPEWVVSVTAASLSDGSVRLYARIPGPGTLTATADGAIPVAKSASRSHRRARAKHVRTKFVRRRVAFARVLDAAGTSGIVQLTLTPKSAYSTFAARRGGLTGTVLVTFTSPGHAPIHEELEVEFKGAPARRGGARVSSGRRASRSNHR